MPLNNYDGSHLPIGQLPAIESIEQDLTSVIWNSLHHCLIGSHSLIDGSTRDAGNTGFTDVLRPGLILTKTAAGKFIEWGSVTSFAADTVEGILLTAVKVPCGGANQDRWIGYVLLGGPVKSKGLIIPGETDSGISGHAQETNLRTNLKFACQLDDDPFSHLATDS